MRGARVYMRGFSKKKAHGAEAAVGSQASQAGYDNLMLPANDPATARFPARIGSLRHPLTLLLDRLDETSLFNRVWDQQLRYSLAG